MRVATDAPVDDSISLLAQILLCVMTLCIFPPNAPTNRLLICQSRDGVRPYRFGIFAERGIIVKIFDEKKKLHRHVSKRNNFNKTKKCGLFDNHDKAWPSRKTLKCSFIVGFSHSDLNSTLRNLNENILVGIENKAKSQPIICL